jgi:hypothetical protein
LYTRRCTAIGTHDWPRLRGGTELRGFRRRAKPHVKPPYCEVRRHRL